ncbi:hypothetical protein COLO4_32248 [Corchorus olitorius]|uniref:Uncharacterized protein n=1 Tax=Corchorus olitorius TaxID=93759 RepID=A0A1R3GZY2_9ROSI|nr:hypothetical protein COLO4_32248 [Corchorus olitorius]
MEAIIDSITKEKRTTIDHLNKVGSGGGNFRSRACAELATRGGDKKAELQFEAMDGIKVGKKKGSLLKGCYPLHRHARMI